jgi:Transglycosylase SLT domain/Peptidase family M23
MQFMPDTWKQWGIDANKDGKKDPYNPADAIFAAARYLHAAGAPKNMRKAIFAYNHAGWYVDSVVLRARLLAAMSPDMLGSLTGLAEARFPVRGNAKYSDQVDVAKANKPVKPGENPNHDIQPDAHRQSIDISSNKGAPVIAVNDGVIKRLGETGKLGRYVELEDANGNTFTYSHLGSLSDRYPVPKEEYRRQLDKQAQNGIPGLAVHDPRPGSAASSGRQAGAPDAGVADAFAGPGDNPPLAGGGQGKGAPLVKERLFAYPDRPAAYANGGAEQMAALRFQSGDPLKDANAPNSLTGYFLKPRDFSPKDFRLAPLQKGAHVMGDSILGRVGDGAGAGGPHMTFAVRPAGKDAPQIDPKPLLDGWKLLEATAIFRANGKNVLVGGSSVGQILLMSKPQLQKRVLADKRIKLNPGGRKDIETGQISRPILAVLEYLAEVGLKPTVSMLRSGHSYLTTSGNVSEHVSGNAVDISAFNDEPVLGHQQKDGYTYQAIKRLLHLQGNMKPHQIISLFDLGPPTLKMADHANHLHVGYRPAGGEGKGGVAAPTLTRKDWYKLMDQLGRIDNPGVGRKPSKDAIPAGAGD